MSRNQVEERQPGQDATGLPTEDGNDAPEGFVDRVSTRREVEDAINRELVNHDFVADRDDPVR